MLAKVVHGTIDAHRVDHAARAVRNRLAPEFAEQSGALRGYWMVDRFSGQLFIVTLWSDGDARPVMTGRQWTGDLDHHPSRADRVDPAPAPGA